MLMRRCTGSTICCQCCDGVASDWLMFFFCLGSTGETPWVIPMVELYHDIAKDNGAIVRLTVNCFT